MISLFGQSGKLGQNDKVHLGLNVSSFVYNCECMVDGSSTMAAIRVLLLVIIRVQAHRS